MTAIASVYCDRCGKQKAAKADAEHARCASARELEPPRYCRHCGRRLVVQVVPRGWTGRCVEHGEISA